MAKRALSEMVETLTRETILKQRKRLDGRAFDQIRPITIEAGVLPRTHGSSLFTRGETQALVTVTLGTSDDTQLIEDLEGESERAFLLHYNFPPFSVGEVKRFGSPGRREIGHGRLAWRSLAGRPARTRRSSRTRSASSPTSSSRTARRRWRRSAAARSPSWTPACPSRARSRASRWAS